MRTELENKIKERLSAIYSDAEKEEKALRLLEKTLDCHRERSQGRQDFTEKDSILITYGDSIVDGQTHGMKVLKDFMGSFVEDAIETIHLLPMYPYTSDDGFSVTDYREINPELGDWEDIRELSEDYGLMFDAVINHISRSSRWFQGYLRGEAPYTDYFITCDPKADYHTVTRPRALPLLTEVQTESGPKHVWTTFSEDQIDLNFQCPELLAEIVDLLLMYADRGARYIRLDAIGFMWKELGTSCMHLPQTHQIIKLFKDILHVYAPKVRIITETNVPHQDNISYFGDDGDEADLVYQFPLPPLVMFSLLTANAKVLSEWMRTLELPSEKVTYFNFLSSHDGIGVRPVEGLLKKEELQILVDATLRNGGEVSYKDNGDGTKSPYELNINYQDALAGPDRPDRERIGKFLAAETILLSLQGVPGIYIHSLLGSRNDYYDKTVSGLPRRINREKLEYSYLKEQLTEDTNRREIFREMIRRLQIRRAESAFSPLARQEVLNLDSRILALVRENPQTNSKICVLVNVSGDSVGLSLPEVRGENLLGQEFVDGSIDLKPWECAWIRQEI
ncbi:MAG: sugar phosphorylase [Blautia sp.]